MLDFSLGEPNHQFVVPNVHKQAKGDKFDGHNKIVWNPF